MPLSAAQSLLTSYTIISEADTDFPFIVWIRGARHMRRVGSSCETIRNCDGLRVDGAQRWVGDRTHEKSTEMGLPSGALAPATLPTVHGLLFTCLSGKALAQNAALSFCGGAKAASGRDRNSCSSVPSLTHGYVDKRSTFVRMFIASLKLQ